MAKPTKADKANIEVLKRIYRETLTNPSRPYGFVSEAEGMPLMQAGYIEVNTAITNESGAAAAILTGAGAEFAGINAPSAATSAGAPNQEGSTVTDTAATTAPAAGYALVSAPLPPSSRPGAGRTSNYPFATMQVGQAFFIPSDGKENFAKSRASNISQANKKYAPRKFVTRAMDAEQAKAIFGEAITGGKDGLGVWRGEDVAPAAAPVQA
jgi:hypothetical protein